MNTTSVYILGTPTKSYESEISSAIFYGSCAVAIPLLFIISIVSNGLNVFMFTRGLPSSRQHVFLSGLAVADAYHLVSPLLFDFLSFGIFFLTQGRFYISILTHYAFGCKFVIGIRHSASLTSVNMILACNVDRMIAIFTPLFSKRFTASQARIIVVILFLLSLLSTLPLVLGTEILYNPNMKTTSCYYIPKHTIGLNYYAIFFTKNCLIQITLIFTLNLCQIYKIVQMQRNRLKMNEYMKADRSFRNKMKGIILNIWISNVFLVIVLPLTATLVARNVAWSGGSSYFRKISSWYEVIMFGFYLQSSFRWVIYVIQNKCYRLKLLEILLRKN